jgi:hypothetical protein
LVLLLAVLPFIMPTALLMLGLLPTLIVLIADEEAEKSSAITVGAMNLAGVVPFVIELWQKGQTMDIAFAILRQPNTWLVMLGAAAVGRLILYVVPPLAASLAITQAEMRLAKLQDSLVQLKQVWGPETATTIAPELVRKQNGS